LTPERWAQIEELRRVADTEKSLALSREFFALWKNADSDLLVRGQARAEYRKRNELSAAAAHKKAIGHDQFSC
jgi:hypothetical protein